MSILSRIRENMSLVVIVIAVAIVGFIATDFLRGIGDTVSTPQVAGEIAGEVIPREEYVTRYQLQVQRIPNLPESQQGYIMDQVWNQLIQERVYDNQFEKAGLEISGDEVYDMFTGNNIHPAVRQSFTSPEGEFNPEQVKQQLQNLLDNPDLINELKTFEDYLARERATERLNNMVKGAFFSSKSYAESRHVNQNKKTDISFLAINYTQIPDSAINVSESELESYLRDNENRYQQEAQTIAKFVSFPLTPTKEDSVRAENSLLRLRIPFSEAIKDSSFTANKSSRPYQEIFQSIGALPENLRDSIANAETGNVLGPYVEGNVYKLYKVVQIDEGEEAFANINHILITPDGASDSDSVAASRLAGTVARQANSSNFFDLANEYSRDFQTKTKGGALGWYQKGRFGEDFDEAVANLPIGAIRGPIKSSQGYHVVQVVDRTNKTYDIAEIEKEIFAGSQTVKNKFQEGNQFLYEANQVGDIDSVAFSKGLNAIQTNPLTPQTRQVVGLAGGGSGRDLVIWALDAKVGEFSDVIEVGDQYVVAQIINKTEEGIRALADVRAEVEQKVRNQKKAKIILEKLKDISTDQDLTEIRDQYGEGAFISSAQNITFESTTIPGIGADLYVIGKISTLEEGQQTNPIEGINGVYILEATKVAPAADLSESSLTSLADSYSTTVKSQIQQKIEPALRESAGVKDLRYKIGF